MTYFSFGIESQSVMHLCAQLLNQFAADAIFEHLLGIDANDADQRRLHHENSFCQDGDRMCQPGHLNITSSYIIKFFERLTRNQSNTPQLNVARCDNLEFIVLSIITSYYNKSISSKRPTTIFSHYCTSKILGLQCFLQYALYRQRNYEYSTWRTQILRICYRRTLSIADTIQIKPTKLQTDFVATVECGELLHLLLVEPGR
jgi:hypothetical protein